ncbi:MAG: zonular occludens toxin family protein [Pseudomonadota bacterium]
MSIVIHHGHPGSFKSFGVLQRHAIPALMADDQDGAPFPQGRTVVTNIRGFDSIEKVEKAMAVRLGDQAQILHVDTEGRDAKAYMARWFHWAPAGSMVIIDEAQAIYPAKRKDFKPEHLDYPGGADQAKQDERPVDMFEAYDMHRHYNWDVFLCTPNISKVHMDIRQSAQVAFRHYSMGELLPWKKGKWREVEHDPENNGKAKSHAYGVPKEYKANPAVFRTYQSTKTGEHQSNQGPQSVFKDKRVMAYLSIAGISLSVFIYMAIGKFQGEQTPEIVPEESVESIAPGKPDVVPDGDSLRDPAPDPENDGRVTTQPPPAETAPSHPLANANLSIGGNIEEVFIFVGEDSEGRFNVSQYDLVASGYSVEHHTRCHATLSFEGEQVQDVYCQPNRIREEPLNPESKSQKLQPFSPQEPINTEGLGPGGAGATMARSDRPAGA